MSLVAFLRVLALENPLLANPGEQFLFDLLPVLTLRYHQDHLGRQGRNPFGDIPAVLDFQAPECGVDYQRIEPATE